MYLLGFIDGYYFTGTLLEAWLLCQVMDDEYVEGFLDGLYYVT